MKKFFYSFFVAVALMLAATSCSQEEMVENGTSGNDVEVSFNVDMEGPQASRAIGDGLTVDQLIFAVYDKNGVEIQSLRQPNVAVSNKGAVVKTRLVKGQEYQFVFWAQKSGQSHYTLNTDGELVVNYQNSPANDETRDAFYHHEPTFKVSGSFSKNVTLKRPFAQLNLGTTPEDLAAAATAGVNMAQSSVKVTRAAYGKMDVLTGKVDDEDIVEVSYTLAAIPDASKEDLVIKDSENQFEVDTYEYLASDYFLANTTSVLSSIEYTLVDDKGNTINKLTIENAPLQRNWRTNIVGEILTGEGTFNIVIDPIFDADRNYPMDGSDLDIWDGTTTEPTKNDAGEYVIDEASDLAYIWSNPTVKWDNATFVLTKDLSFKNVETRAGDTTPATIKPLFGEGNGAMNITFKGNDHVIRDFIIKGENGLNSLFGALNGGKVENLTIINANVIGQEHKDANAAIVVARTFSNLKLYNITVKDSHLEGVQKVGGLVGQVAWDQSDVEILNCTVEGLTVKSIDMAGESGSTGGLIGAANGNVKIENSYVKNSTLDLIQSVNEAKRANSEFIGVILNSNVTINNCGVENVTLTNSIEWTAYYPPFVGGNRGGASLTVDGITLDASSVIVRTAAEFKAAVENANVKNIYLVGGTTYDHAELVKSVGTKTILSLDANNKGIISGKFVVASNLTFKNVAFKPSAKSAEKLNVNTYGKTASKYPAILTLTSPATFEECSFLEIYDTHKAYAINYWVGEPTGMLTINNCSFTGKSHPIYSLALCEITNSKFDLDGASCPIYLYSKHSGQGSVIFKNNTITPNLYCTIGFTSEGGTYKNVKFDVQKNTASPTNSVYAAANSVRFATDGSITFAEGSDRFNITAEELTNAIKNATADITINFGANITGTAVANQKVGVNVIIDGKNYKYDGTLEINGDGRIDGLETLTIQNIKFETTSNKDFINANENTKYGKNYNYAHNVTVKNCTFTADITGENKVVAMRYRQPRNMVIENCIGTGLHSMLWATGTSGTFVVDGVNVESVSGGLSFDTSVNVTVKNTKVKATGDYAYGIRTKASGAYNLKVKDCTLDAAAPILIREATGAYTMTMEGTNTLTADNTNGYQIIVTKTDFAEGTALTAPTGSITLNGVEGYSVYK